MTSLLTLVCGPSRDVTVTSKLPSCENFLLLELSSESLFLSLYSINFVFRIGSISVSTCGWLLYVHWPWFKRLVKSGLQESRTRIVTLPQDAFTGVAARTIITVLQFGHMDSFDHLNQNDTISIIEHAAAFELINLDGKVLPRVKTLIDACETRVYLPLTRSNCFHQIRLAHSSKSSRYRGIVQFIAHTVYDPSPEELAILPEEVVLDLERMTRSRDEMWSPYRPQKGLSRPETHTNHTSALVNTQM